MTFRSCENLPKFAPITHRHYYYRARNKFEKTRRKVCIGGDLIVFYCTRRLNELYVSESTHDEKAFSQLWTVVRNSALFVELLCIAQRFFQSPISRPIRGRSVNRFGKAARIARKCQRMYDRIYLPRGNFFTKIPKINNSTKKIQNTKIIVFSSENFRRICF